MSDSILAWERAGQNQMGRRALAVMAASVQKAEDG
jgi:hypothetical protein